MTDERTNARAARRQRLIRLRGTWGDLDADEVLDALDRIRHSNPPTSPMDEQLAWMARIWKLSRSHSADPNGDAATE